MFAEVFFAQLRRFARSISIAGMALIAFSCSSKSGAPVVTELSTTNQAGSDFTYSLYSLNSTSQESSFIGTLQQSSTGLEWPNSMSAYIQQVSSGKTQVQYFVKAAASSGGAGLNGDVYYESPVTGSSIVFNGPTTALWYALRTSYASQHQATYLSNTDWQDLLFEIDTACTNCLSKSGSATFQLLQSSSSVLSSVNQVLGTLGMPAVTSAGLQNPPISVGFSTPILTNGAATLSAAQAGTQNVQVLFVDPLELSQFQNPDSWGILLPNSSTETAITPQGDPSQISYTFDKNNTGTETISAFKSVRGVQYSANLVYQVSYTLEPPVVYVPPQTFQANHNKSIDLSAYASDPRNETLNYSLVSVPNGMSLAGSNLSWNPTQEPISQVGTGVAEISVNNTDGGVTLAYISLVIYPDSYPQFGSVPATWTLSEASLGALDFPVNDSDGDPIEISCIAGCGALLSDFPTGAGWPVTAYPNAMIYGGSPGAESVSIPFMPSYLQEIGANGSFPITLSVNYPVSDSNLRQVSSPGIAHVQLQITNIADPPVWTVQPQPNPVPTPTENIAMNPMTGGSASDPAYNPGAHGVTYSISNLSGTPGNASNCAWISVDPASAAITGTPPYNSAGTCSFTVRATDPLGLSADSAQIVSIPVHHVSLPFNPPNPIPDQTATEAIQFKLDMANFFNDPQQQDGDPLEHVTYSCLNCGALGIPTAGANGLTFSGDTLQWTPAYTTAPSGGQTTFTGIQIQATNVGGNTSTDTFNLTVDDAPAPMVLSFADGSLIVSGNIVTIDPETTGTVTLQIANMAGDSSAYPYTISTACSPSCSIDMDGLSTTTGSSPGTTNVTLMLGPIYSDGYGGGSASYGTHTITYSVTDQNDPTVVGTAQLIVHVTTVDRPFTALVVAGDNFTSTYFTNINGAAYSSNLLSLSVQGPDASNDNITYAFTSGNFGTLSGPSWSFNPVAAGCLSGSQVVVKDFTITATSSHGASISRDFTARISNALPGGGGSCPY